MTAQTPIKCFVRFGNLFFVEDYAGTRMPVCLAADEAQAEWLAYTLQRAHQRSVRAWDYEETETAAKAAEANASSAGQTATAPDRAPDGAPWYAHDDGPCGPACGDHK